MDNRNVSMPLAAIPGSLQEPAASHAEPRTTGSIAPALLRPATTNLYRPLAIVAMTTFIGFFMGCLGANAGPTPDSGLLENHQRDDQRPLRTREDTVRDRLWVLTADHVYVYDTRKLKLIRRIRLPNWSVADFMCPPDLALDQAGNAWVSNNVQPRLLEIGVADFTETEHQITLISKKQQWEIGFGALAFGSNGTLFGLTALAGSLFRIDLARQSAEEIALTKPAPGACALTYLGQNHPRAQPRVVSLCVGRDNHSRRVDLSSDLARGLVINEFCEG